MEAGARAGFWRGPITSEAQARRIITWAGWTFLVIAGAGAVSAVKDYHPSAGYIIRAGAGCLLLIGPAAALLLSRNRAAATILFAVSLIALVSMAVWGLIALGKDADQAIGILFVAVIWVPLTILSWRARKAARALPSLKA